MNKEATDFEDQIGSTYTVTYSSGKFNMKLLEVTYSKHPAKLTWEPLVKIRDRPFSLLFESDQKILIRETVEIEREKLSRTPLHIEPIAESKNGYIYQAAFN